MTSPTDKPIADKELAEIEALANAATAGPWMVSVDSGPDDVRVCYERDGACHWCIALSGDTVDGKAWSPETLARWNADARFIAASRTLVPALVAEVRALRAENAKLRAVADAARNVVGKYHRGRLDPVRKEIEPLVESVEALAALGAVR